MLADLQGSGCCRVVVLHHPPVRALTAYRRRLVDDKSLGVVLAERGADLVLCGHEHELKLGSLPGPTHRIPVVVAPSASQGAPPKQQGGYLVYTLERHGDVWTVGFELRAFDPEAGILPDRDRRPRRRSLGTRHRGLTPPARGAQKPAQNASRGESPAPAFQGARNRERSAVHERA